MYIDYTDILNRESISNDIITFLDNFQNNSSKKRAIYITGAYGIGKTTFIINILKKINYKYIEYDSTNFKSKEVLDIISSNNISNTSVLSLFKKKPQKIAIIIDDIDNIRHNDRGVLNNLIKLIRPKKTIKQKQKDISCNLPIICIGTKIYDKKIKELMSVCKYIELPNPTNKQIKSIIIKNIDKNNINNININTINKFTNYIDKNLHKIDLLLNNIVIYNTLLYSNIINSSPLSNNTNTIILKLLKSKINLDIYKKLIHESDRTIIGLLWHENVETLFQLLPTKELVLGYSKFLNNICYADCIDRITFQKQTWEFSDLSGIIKIYFTNNIYHNYIKEKYNNPIRFTKILTKYSTSYNNSIFIQGLSSKLGLEKKNLINHFIKLKKKNSINYIYKLFEIYDITKLDINRLYKYIDNYCDL